MVHKVISRPYKVNVNFWMPPSADKSLRDCNMTVRKTPVSALWPVTNKCVVIETERLLREKFIYKNRSHDMGANWF